MDFRTRRQMNKLDPYLLLSFHDNRIIKMQSKYFFLGLETSNYNFEFFPDYDY